MHKSFVSLREIPRSGTDLCVTIPPHGHCFNITKKATKGKSKSSREYTNISIYEFVYLRLIRIFGNTFTTQSPPPSHISPQIVWPYDMNPSIYPLYENSADSFYPAR